MRHLALAGAAACALIFTAAFASAQAGSVVTMPGTSFVIPVENPADHPTEGSDSQNFWTDQGLFDNSDDPSKASEEAPSGGDPEIRGLKEEFPETNWPSKRN